MHIFQSKIINFPSEQFYSPPPPFFSKRRGKFLFLSQILKLQFFKEFQELWEFYFYIFYWINLLIIKKN